MSDTQPTNRLSRESSPYLLQHQHNPVDWYPWGPEAFERAAAEDKAIFLSVGYSTCYWCHVMERESFENPAVAAEMNRRFVCIKVDREERPDVDQLYMTAVQILTRHGGWPMSVFLTPDRRPFYGGTYFPPQDSARGMGFISLMEQVDQAWRQRRADVEKSAGEIADILGRLAVPPNVEGRLELDEAFVHSLIERSVSDFDEETGGFGGAPKFPRQTLLMLILAYLDDPQSVGPGDSELKTRLRAMMTRTLDAMADGGIRDQLGGGFHRYSTDAHWIVPHFEIMLYDNALLAWIYAEAHRQTGQPSYAAVARGVLDFILREMTSDDGVFYTAFDAEVDGREGQSYLWTPDEVKQVLGEAGWDEQGVKMFLDAYNLDAQPNFADPHHGTGQPDHWVLHRTGPMEAVAKLWNRSLEALEEALSHMRQDLLAARRKREQPSLDRKILTSWNALMIRALTHGGMALKEPRYLAAAARAADWLRRHHMTSDGVLLHASRPDRPGRQVPGFLEDYAGLAMALMELHRAEGRGQSDRDEWITQLLDAMDERFGDAAGGFYFTDVKADDLIVRQKVGYDSPLPSGNGLAAMALQMAGRHEAADRILEVFAQSMHRQGEGMSTLVEAALRRVAGAGPMTVEGEARSIPAAPPPREPVSLWAQWLSPTRLAVTARIAHGFHLNAHDAPAGLIGTRLAIGSPYDTWIRAIDYPPGEEQAYAFHDRPLKVYTGQVTFTLDFRAVPDVSAQPLSLVLHYQPCTDDACQRPTRQILEVSGR